MQRYLIVIEKAEANYAAYAPDLPGCIATGKTVSETREAMQSAIRMHLGGLAEDDLPIPVPQTTAEYLAVTS
ncbi:MAG: type II toxin-antitoxin system HicB family antitoxin [Chloroflexi bacterium]|nr:type II toxin-antitoxin system HicB family antitoxin [Chloroflexota bacterium]